jgi:hypothetical protein
MLTGQQIETWHASGWLVQNSALGPARPVSRLGKSSVKLSLVSVRSAANIPQTSDTRDNRAKPPTLRNAVDRSNRHLGEAAGHRPDAPYVRSRAGIRFHESTGRARAATWEFGAR